MNLFKEKLTTESSGVKTQFLKGMVEFCDTIGKTIQLLYYPPYHSKYNPIERCYSLMGMEPCCQMLKLCWASSMTWKGLHPIVNLSLKLYQKGISVILESDALD